MATGEEVWVVSVTTSVDVALPPITQRVYQDCPQAEAMRIARMAVENGDKDEYVVKAVARFVGYEDEND